MSDKLKNKKVAVASVAALTAVITPTTVELVEITNVKTQIKLLDIKIGGKLSNLDNRIRVLERTISVHHPAPYLYGRR